MVVALVVGDVERDDGAVSSSVSIISGMSSGIFGISP